VEDVRSVHLTKRLERKTMINRSLLFISLLLLLPNKSYAAGYELLEQSAEGVGQAFSGSSTGYGDGSEVFFNPAAMAELSSENVTSASIHLVMPHGEFENQGSSYVPQLGSIPISGNNGGDAGDIEVVPNAYIAHKLNDSVALGLGVNSPFGLVSEYNDTWVGRYHAIKSELTTVNINPAIGVKICDSISVGAGLQVMYADAELTNAIDFGTIGVSTLGLPTATSLGLLPQSTDGFGKVEGDDWGVGYGLSALIKPSEDVKLGVSFRSKIDLTLDGDGTFTVPSSADVLTSTGLFTDQTAQAKVSLPESITFGGAFDVEDNWTLFGDATWIKWNRFQELRVTFDGAQPDFVQEENWDNTWRFAIGAKHKLSESWDVRAGFASDETPIQSDEFRTPRIPDNDRYWMALGLGYDVSPTSRLSASYAHLFIPDASSVLPNSTGATLVGDWDLSVELFSVSYSASF